MRTGCLGFVDKYSFWRKAKIVKIIILYRFIRQPGLRRIKVKEERLKRNNRLTLMLNNREMRAFNIYCQRYRVKNKSRFLRETVMNTILKRFDEDLPSLFEVNEPDLFNKQKIEQDQKSDFVSMSQPVTDD